MKTRMMISAVLVVAGLATSAMAQSTMQGRFAGGVIGQGVNSTAGNFNTGALQHQFWGASNATMAVYTGGAATQGAAASVYSFCIDNRTAINSTQLYTLNGIQAAPVSTAGNFGSPGQNYNSNEERRLNAIMLAARQLNLVDNRGFFWQNATLAGSTTAEISTAMQLLVWESVWDDAINGSAATTWDVTSAAGAGNAFRVNGSLSTGVTNALNAIRNLAFSSFLGSNQEILVRAISTTSGTVGNENGQDQVVLIPLPPAAWAGLGTLVGAMGLFQLRRRSLAAQPS